MKKVSIYQFLVAYMMFAVCSLQLNAQSADTLKMSLQECIDYALKNSSSIENAKLEEQVAKSKVGEVRAIGLPQVSATAGIQHNLRLRDIYGESSQASPFAARDPATGQLLIPEGQIFKIPNIFQLRDGLDASLSISQILFSGSYIVGLQAAQAYKDLAAKSTEQSLVQTKANVTKAYYFTLINLERMYLFDVNIARVDSLLLQTKTLQKNGFVESIDVDRLEVTLNNLLTERQKFENMLVLSSVLLKFQMGMPISNNIFLTEKLKDYTLNENAISDSKADYNNRPEYQQLKVSRRLQELAVKNNNWSAMPTLVASANLGLFTQNSDLGKLFTGSNFNDKNQMWSKYGLIQLGLTVPIFGGGSRMYQTQQSKLKLKQVDNNIKNFEKAYDLQTKQAELNFKNSIKSLESQNRNMTLAKNVTDVTRKKYKQGVGSNIEVITAESSLKEAQINYYNALFEAITNKVEYDLATGNIK
jgi:outer membrane protein TolC